MHTAQRRESTTDGFTRVCRRWRLSDHVAEDLPHLLLHGAAMLGR